MHELFSFFIANIIIIGKISKAYGSKTVNAVAGKEKLLTKDKRKKRLEKQEVKHTRTFSMIFYRISKVLLFINLIFICFICFHLSGM